MYEKKMYHIAYSILHDSQQAEDAVMEAFAKILKHNYVVKNPESDRTKRLIIRIIRSVSIDMYRKSKRQYDHEALYDIAKWNTEIAEREKDDESEVRGADGLTDIIDELPEIYQKVLYERYYNELSFDEIARILGISEGAARKRHARGLAMLRERKERKNYA